MDDQKEPLKNEELRYLFSGLLPDDEGWLFNQDQEQLKENENQQKQEWLVDMMFSRFNPNTQKQAGLNAELNDDKNHVGQGDMSVSYVDRV